MCRRAEAMGVTLGVIVSTTVESKQKNLLNWLRGVQTDLVGWISRLRVRCQAWEQELETEYNYYTARPKHWHGSQGFTGVLIKNNVPNSTKRNVLRKRDLLSSRPRKSLGTEIQSLPSGSEFSCHSNKADKCLFPSCLTVIAWFGFSVFGNIMKASFNTHS